MKLSQRMATQMKLSPQIVVSSKLLRASTAEMEKILAAEMAANPALVPAPRREGPSRSQPASLPADPAFHQRLPSWTLGARSQADRSRDDSGDDLLERIPARLSVFEQLALQIKQIASGEARSIALILVYCLDERGYLTVSPEQLAEQIGASIEQVRQGIGILHQLEPAGIGARDLRQCLSLQCQELCSPEAGPDDPAQVAGRILETAWEDFLHQRWGRVRRLTGLSPEAIEGALKFIRCNVHPYPLSLLSAADEPAGNPQIIWEPDLIIRKMISSGRSIYRVEIPGEQRYLLGISVNYSATLETPEDFSVQERAWVRTQVERGRQVILAVQHRWDTLRRLGQYLVEHQQPFLEQGPIRLQPMTRQQVARALGVHESTICRAVLEKTVLLPNGQIAPLSNFFDAALPIKERIAQIVAQTPGRLSDREIAEQLGAQGVQVARRTITKYRLGSGQAQVYRRAGRLNHAGRI